MNTLSTAILAAVALATFAAAPRVDAQADLEFAGGEGAPLDLTLDAPVTYLVTTSTMDGPGFDFQGVGDIFPREFATVTGSITFTIDGGLPQTITTINSEYDGGELSATDVYVFGAIPGVEVGDTVVLNAGSLTTAAAFSGAPPASGSYQTFLFDGAGTKLDAVNGTSVPEPSVWSLVLAGAGLLGLTLTRRAVLPARAGDSSVAMECSRPAAARCCSPR